MAFGHRNEDHETASGADDQAEETGRFRWLPGVVVTAAFAGFIALAWHAYHYGAQSLDDGQLVVVEADQTPMKEKPLDPGGMKFPNQDKTVFETFSGNGGTPPKVERIMPPPEEPMPKNIESSETQTWINDKLKEPVAAKPEETQPVASKQLAEEAKQASAETTTAATEAAKDTSNQAIVTHVKKVEAPAKAEELMKPQEPEKAETVKEEKKPEAKVVAAKRDVKKDAGGKQRIQLGAYGSEDEAKAAWSKMQAKFPELKGKTVYVVKADLGAKGIFYRLRAGGFADAKGFCAGLSAKGQACMMVP